MKREVSKEGTVRYYDGELHREKGAAVIYTNGNKHWYLNGKRHREDGPAVVWAGGTEGVWYLNGKKYSKKEFEVKIKLLNSKILKVLR